MLLAASNVCPGARSLLADAVLARSPHEVARSRGSTARRRRKVGAVTVGVQSEIADTRPESDLRVVPKPIRYGVGGVLFVLAIVLPLLRQTGTPSWRTIWAEDGSIYFQQAYRHGGLAVLFRGYGGYLQLPPRLLGGISAFIPIGQLALFLAVSAQVVNALLATFVYWASDGWITSRLARLALASLVVLMPVLVHENTATISNTIWTFVAVAPWALVSLAERPLAVSFRSIVAFLAATATALAAIFVPLAIGYALIRKTRATWMVVIAFCTGLAVQAAVVSHTKDDRRHALHAVRQVSRVPELISVRVVAQYLLADKGIGSFWDHRRLLVVAAPIVLVAILTALLPGATFRIQLLAASFIALAVITFVVPVWGRGTPAVALTAIEAPTSLANSTGTAYPGANRSPRFSVVPVMMLASAAGLLLAGSRRRKSRTTRIWPVVFVAHIALLTIINFSSTNTRSHDRSWSSTVDSAYRTQCAGERPANLITVSTGMGFFFPVTLRCGDLAP